LSAGTPISLKLIKKNGVTYLNPGSAGHRRFDYPVSVARVRIENGTMIPRIFEIDL
jgi:predicted phosphodiesterase